MKKLTLLLLTLTACKIGADANKAEVMVKAQAPKASCKTGRLGTTDVALCEVPGKDKIVSFITLYGDKGFKVYNLDEVPPMIEGQGSGAQATPPPAPPAAPTVDAGVK